MLTLAQSVNPALAPLLDHVQGRFVTADALARRWQWSVQHLANLRRAAHGPAYVRIGRSVRYPAAEVLAWELYGLSAHITLDRVRLVASAFPADDATRARLIAHFEQALSPKR